MIDFMRVKPGARTNCILYFYLTCMILVKYVSISTCDEGNSLLADWSFTYYGLGLRNWFKLLNYLMKSSWLYKISTQVRLDNVHSKTVSCPAVVDWPSCHVWLVERENVSCPDHDRFLSAWHCSRVFEMLDIDNIEMEWLRYIVCISCHVQGPR